MQIFTTTTTTIIIIIFLWQLFDKWTFFLIHSEEGFQPFRLSRSYC